MEGPHESGQLVGEHIRHDVLVVRCPALEPGHHGPREGIAVTRTADRDGHRQGRGKVTGQDREPPLVGVGLGLRPADDREPGDQLVAEPVEVVVGAELLDPAHRQGRP